MIRLESVADESAAKKLCPGGHGNNAKLNPHAKHDPKAKNEGETNGMKFKDDLQKKLRPVLKDTSSPGFRHQGGRFGGLDVFGHRNSHEEQGGSTSSHGSGTSSPRSQ